MTTPATEPRAERPHVARIRLLNGTVQELDNPPLSEDDYRALDDLERRARLRGEK